MKDKQIALVSISILLVFVCVTISFFFLQTDGPEATPLMSVDEVAEIIEPQVQNGQFTDEIEIPDAKEPEHKESLSVEYTIQNDIQSEIQKLFKRYRPDYGAFVAIDADTGEVLNLVSYSAKENEFGNLTLHGSFPAASVFKIVSAAAAVDSGKVSADTVIPYNGRNSTLYKRNVLHTRNNRWTRHLSLKEAFGRSVNTVFGKLGLFYLDPQHLKEYAKRFGFNRSIKSELQFDKGIAKIADSKEWSLAETASGFTRKNTMSPLQGALIAGSVVNDGKMMVPHIVRSIYNSEHELLFKNEKRVASISMTEDSAFELQKMMSETIESGTGRRIFRPFLRDRRFKNIEVGGKSGSLTGNEPKGKCDWFVGYAKFPENSRKIALAALTVNVKYWKVKSAYLARRFIEKYSLHLQKEQEEKSHSEEIGGQSTASLNY